jgi:hypothetical protein
MANKQKYVGFFEANTVEIEINGEKVRVWKGEAKKIKAKLAKKEKK